MCFPALIPALAGASTTAGLAAAQGAAFGAGASALAASTAASTAASAISLRTLLQIGGQVVNTFSSLQAQRNAKEQAELQNKIAFANRLNKERAEGLRIRQIRDRENAKRFQTSLEGREARATVRTAAEGFGGGVLDRLVADYFRQEGRYNSAILSNLEAEQAQSRQNFESFVTGQEAQSTYVPQVDYITTFASAATAFGQDYLDYRSDQLAREQAMKTAQQNIGIN